MTQETPQAIKAWQEFSKEVETHLANYSIPQYGDLDVDEISKYSIEMCIAQMQRYLSRHGKNQRPSEDERTFMKVAVYAFRAHLKMSEPKDGLVYLKDDFGGRHLKKGEKYILDYDGREQVRILTENEINWKIA